METINGLTIVICTRNRPNDLQKCLISIAKQKLDGIRTMLEVLIVDDGFLSNSILKELQKILGGIPLKYIKKNDPGLFLSRKVAILNSQFDRILFLDDDVEIDNPLYIETLLQIYSTQPETVGISGVDLLIKRPSWLSWLYNTIFLLKSNKPGKLSLTGYGVSMKYWKEQTDCFETEFLSGCNMSFRKKVLCELEIQPWLTNYSLGEDQYLSLLANRRGKLLVNPHLTVRHNLSQLTRDRLEQVAYSEIVNHFYLLKLRKAKRWQHWVHLWTSLGLLVKAVLTANFRKIKGYVSGFGFILTH